MRVDEIQVGKTYRGKSGRVRKVVGAGRPAYSNQMDTDVVSYTDVNAGITAKTKDMTRRSFASWAKEEV